MAALGLPSPETLSPMAQVAQLVVVRATGHLFDHQRRYPQWELANADLQHCVETLGVGGVILLGGSAAEVGVRTQQLQGWAETPLLLAADVEEGIGQRFAGATQFPPPMALSAIARQDLALASHYAEQMGAITAQEAQAIGLNWLLAPVVDVNNNPANPVINVRAFGDTPELVEQLANAFIRGAQRFSVLTTAKHFPGHGDTAVDSHLHLPEIPHDYARLDQVELLPFRGAIAAGVDAVMTAHLRVPALDPQFPATLSKATLTDLLRRSLGFDGLVVTDALVMGAITDHYGPYEAAVMALEAGADVLLMPKDPEGTIQAVCEAVRVGRLSPERILTSVERLWRAKQKAGSPLTIPPEACHAWEHLPPPPVQLGAIAQATSRQLATDMTVAAMEVEGQIPMQPAEAGARSLVMVDDVLATGWLNSTAPAIALPAQCGYRPRLVDSGACAVAPDAVMASQGPTLLQVFSRGNPFRGSAGLRDEVLQWFRGLQSTGCLAGLVVYGSPYAWKALLEELLPDVPRGFCYGQMPAAQTAVLLALLASVGTVSAADGFTD